MTETQRDLARAQAMLDVKRHDEAADLLARVIASNPENSRAWCLLAATHLRANRYRDAADAANQAVAVSPSNEWAHRLVSNANVYLGDAPAAVRAAKEACRQAPEQWRAWVCLAQAALMNERVPYVLRQQEVLIAERAAEIARRLAPDEAEVYFVSGRASLARWHVDKARIYHEKALALDPTHARALNELGRISLKSRHLERSADYFTRAARSAPDIAVYSRNVLVPVWAIMLTVIYVTTVLTSSLIFVVLANGRARSLAAPGLIAVALVSALIATRRLMALPPATRPLLRTRRLAALLAGVYGSIIFAIIASVAVPPIGRWAVLAEAGVLIIASAYATMRARRPWARPARRA